IVGIAFVFTAILLYLRKQAALSLYALVIVGSLVWAIWEVGLDWWQLGPRGGVIILLGFWLLTPWIRRPLGFQSPTGENYPVRALLLVASLLVSVAVAGVSMFMDPHKIEGDLPTETVVAAPRMGNPVPPGEWHQYGRTNFGQRYSPLDQINVDNVNKLEEVWRFQTGDVKLPEDVGETTYQVTPLKVANTLYLCTPHNWAIALDATTGQQRWKFDPNAGLNP